MNSRANDYLKQNDNKKLSMENLRTVRKRGISLWRHKSVFRIVLQSTLLFLSKAYIYYIYCCLYRYSNSQNYYGALGCANSLLYTTLHTKTKNNTPVCGIKTRICRLWFFNYVCIYSFCIVCSFLQLLLLWFIWQYIMRVYRGDRASTVYNKWQQVALIVYSFIVHTM